MTFRTIALGSAALATAAVLAACGGGAPTVAPTVAAPTVEPTTLEVPSFDRNTFAPPSFALPSMHGDADLEALLPDAIGGQVVVKQSLRGEAILRSGFAGGAPLEAMLDDVGASIGDVSVAIGAAGTSVVVLAYRIDGVSAQRTFEGLLEPLASGGSGAIQQVTVGDRTVSKIDVGGETTYIYLAGDVVFILGGSVTGDLLADAVSQLPEASR